jgi:hypothetical protein
MLARKVLWRKHTTMSTQPNRSLILEHMTSLWNYEVAWPRNDSMGSLHRGPCVRVCILRGERGILLT